MCGIAGLIHKGKSSNVGREMTAMLQALKHRGPDSTGYAVYGEPTEGDYVLRLKVAEAEDMAKGRGIHQVLADRIAAVEAIMQEHGVTVKTKENATEYALRYLISHDGDTAALAEHIEETEGVEILSLGNGLELIKDLGDASDVAGLYGLNEFNGTHGIGHTRMATESDVDIRSAHPYWAFPYNDVSVVHNGQITNYWIMRRQMERKGHRFMSNCDSELLAVYTANNLANGVTLEQSLSHPSTHTGNSTNSPGQTASAKLGVQLNTTTGRLSASAAPISAHSAAAEPAFTTWKFMPRASTRSCPCFSQSTGPSR